MKEDLKLLRKVVGAFLLAFGCWFGCMFYGLDAHNEKDTTKPQPINDINGIAVDSDGNIYVGDMERSIIQVFGANGAFLYGFYVPTWRYYVLGIDEQDIIHVVGAMDSHHGYLRGEELFEEEVTYEEEELLKDKYQMNSGHTFHTEDKTYRLSLFHRLTVTQADGGKEVVTLQAPYWPPPFLVWWTLSVVSLLMFIAQIASVGKTSEKKRKK